MRSGRGGVREREKDVLLKAKVTGSFAPSLVFQFPDVCEREEIFESTFFPFHIAFPRRNFVDRSIEIRLNFGERMDSPNSHVTSKRARVEHQIVKYLHARVCNSHIWIFFMYLHTSKKLWGYFHLFFHFCIVWCGNSVMLMTRCYHAKEKYYTYYKFSNARKGNKKIY